MTFGIKVRKKRTGADVSLLIFQISTLLIVPYMSIIPGYLYVLTKRGFLANVFDLGLSAVPRWEALGVSWIYRRTCSEVLAYFILLSIALAAGLVIRRLLQGSYETAVKTRVVLAALIAADLAVRLLPVHFNAIFGTACAVFGFAVRLICLVLILLDLHAARSARREAQKGGEA